MQMRRTVLQDKRTLSKNENSKRVSFFVSVMVEIPWEGGKRGARISDSANGSTHKLTQE